MNQKTIETYLNKLNACGVSEESCNILRDKYGPVVFPASWALKNTDGTAYEGSMIEISLKKLAPFAVRINELYPEDMRADVNSIVKVCLLQHLSKGLRFIKSTDTWRINNLNEVYKFNSENMPSIGFGLHSIMMAIDCGIKFDQFEVEAMTVIDKKEDDAQTKYYSSLLTNIIRHANEMVYVYHQELMKMKNV